MSVYKRGKIWQFDFQFRGKRYFGSTRLRNKVKAELFESARRTMLAMGEVGLAIPKTAPYLRDFLAIDGKFLAHVRLSAKPNTVKCYEQACLRLLEFANIADRRLNLIDKELIEDFVQHRSKTVAVGCINRDLAVLRHSLKTAEEWGYITKAPKIRRIPGEKQREYVISGAIERKYLEVAPSPLKEAVTLMLDTGLRPDELLRLRKTDILLANPLTPPAEQRRLNDSVGVPFVPAQTKPALIEAIVVREGKSKNARRTIPLPKRSREVINFLFAFWPDSEWLFKGKNGHLTISPLEKAHTEVKLKTVDEDGKPIFPKEFVLYSCRHTAATRLAESGADSFAIMKIMGHGSIMISERYIHPGANHIEMAMARKEMLDRMLRGEIHSEVAETGMKSIKYS